jgi:hypothetical protein
MQNTASAVPVIFNMRTFLNYYKDPANPDIFIDPNPPITKYYKTKDILETKQLEPQYIIIRRPFYGVTVAGGRKRAIKYMRTRYTKKKRSSLKTHS